MTGLTFRKIAQVEMYRMAEDLRQDFRAADRRYMRNPTPANLQALGDAWRTANDAFDFMWTLS